MLDNTTESSRLRFQFIKQQFDNTTEPAVIQYHTFLFNHCSFKIDDIVKDNFKYLTS